MAAICPVVRARICAVPRAMASSGRSTETAAVPKAATPTVLMAARSMTSRLATCQVVSAATWAAPSAANCALTSASSATEVMAANCAVPSAAICALVSSAMGASMEPSPEPTAPLSLLLTVMPPAPLASRSTPERKVVRVRPSVPDALCRAMPVAAPVTPALFKVETSILRPSAAVSDSPPVTGSTAALTPVSAVCALIASSICDKRSSAVSASPIAPMLTPLMRMSSSSIPLNRGSTVSTIRPVAVPLSMV